MPIIHQRINDFGFYFKAFHSENFEKGAHSTFQISSLGISILSEFNLLFDGSEISRVSFDLLKTLGMVYTLGEAETRLADADFSRKLAIDWEKETRLLARLRRFLGLEQKNRELHKGNINLNDPNVKIVRCGKKEIAPTCEFPVNSSFKTPMNQKRIGSAIRRRVVLLSQEVKRKSLKSILVLDTIDGVFPCKLCKKRFSKDHDLFIHFLQEHFFSANGEICEEAFVNVVLNLVCKNSKSGACPICLKIVGRKDFFQHVRKWHFF